MGQNRYLIETTQEAEFPLGKGECAKGPQPE